MSDTNPSSSVLTIPWVGTLLTTLSGLSFLLVLMVLPLVGKASVATTYAKENARAFLVTLLISMAFGVLAVWSKLLRRRHDHSPLPLFTLALMAILLMLLIAIFANLLSI